MAPTLHVVVASTRPGRVGPYVGAWAVDAALRHGWFDVELVDLAEEELPLFDEPNPPRIDLYTKEHTRRWSAKVSRADAFVFITPEYNHGAPPSLVNALSYLYHEWLYKPVGFISYGGPVGGARSVQMIKQIVTSLKMMPIPEAVSIPLVYGQPPDDQFRPDPRHETAASSMLDELRRWADALAQLRHPGESFADSRDGAA